ncbi:hypothetical protein KTD31_03265 [Burkholderia multivorans]|jgi:hypothetical protein|uniref:hypothetical protein n=1 Tax=Burkholderia multivorans TaxID=87883 RepID=UPI001C2283D3|nr:hypothetical protein [Burkholderia multivorans]MBU9200372.1 hypothetical protein [Burkholderia multivorans]
MNIPRPRIERAFKYTVIGFAVLAVASVVSTYWLTVWPLAYATMLGSIGRNGVNPAVSALVTAATCAILVSVYGRPRRRLLAACQVAGIFAATSAAFFSAMLWLHTLAPAHTMTRLVTIEEVDGNEEEPDCLWAYYFKDSVGNDTFVCSDNPTRVAEGTRARVVERRNFYGISITEFTFLTNPAVKLES